VIDKSVFESAPESNWLHEGLTPDEIEESRIKAKVMMLLQDFRREHGYTQRQLGKLLGVTQGLVSRWENGDENIKISTLAKIAVVTGAVIEINYSGLASSKQISAAI
jgi:DNA-binding XRE family transcriptional regulator